MQTRIGRRAWHRAALAFAAWGVVVAAAPTAFAQEKAAGADPAVYEKIVGKGLEFLAARQGPDGSFSTQAGIGPSALVIEAFLAQGRTPKDPVVAKGLKFLEGHVQADGGIYKGRIPVYETCIALMTFKAANADGQYDKIIAGAEKFLRGSLQDEADGKQPADPSFGGAGYSNDVRGRPDLSNTAFLIDALKAAGVGPEDEAMKKALVFVSRCQNLESEHNQAEWAARNNDGGFIYTPVAGKGPGPGQQDEEPHQSYGSMSYAGLKSMIYCGLTQEDPRYKAVIGWIRKNYAVDNHPGKGDAGLYYYYHTFAKTLKVLDQPTIADDKGVKHDWKKELVAELARRQQPDGSWANENKAWMESDPNLATAFALLALSYANPNAPAEAAPAAATK